MRSFIQLRGIQDNITRQIAFSKLLFDLMKLFLYNKSMQFNQEQINTLAKYFSDLSKILFGSTVLGFFIPAATSPITMSVFVIGIITTASCLIFSIRLLK